MTAYEWLLKLHSSPSTDCVIWPFKTDRGGYGRVKLEGKTYGAHRVIFKIAHGDWPKHNALHSCDNPSCVNPLHIEDGTTAENQKQKAERGRSLRGESQHDAKLTESLVRKMRSEYRKNVRGCGFHVLAKKYGISKVAAKAVIRGKTWRHVV